MSNTVFSPEHKTINSIFERDIKYRIPAYQRPYSWEAQGKNDRNSQINNMWDDFYDLFERKEDTEYFFGSIVVYKEKDYLNIVDGQQRLTSLLLLFGAMKCFLEKSKNRLSEENSKGIENFINRALMTIEDTLFNQESISLNPTLKLKIENLGSNGTEFDNILEKIIKCESVDSVLKDNKYKNVIDRYFSNRDYFIKQLENRFLIDKKFTIEKVKEFENFWKFLRTKISIVMIKTTDLKTAFSIFEVLNNRGLPLSNKDLFRNFLIREFDKFGESNPEGKWKHLESSYNLTSDFLGRFIESKKGNQLNKSAYNAVIDYYEKDMNGDIQKLYSELEIYLKYYTMITNENNINDICIRNKIRFIKLLGYERNSINYLMALFHYFKYNGGSDKRVLEHINLYEQMRLYIYLKPRKRFSTSPIYSSIKELNKRDLEKSKEYFTKNMDTNDLRNLINEKIKDNGIGKLLIAKYIYAQNCIIKDVITEQIFDYNQSTLEHIIPQNPERGSNWYKNFSKKFRDEYTYKLGNFTLLTTNMNSSAKNFDFEEKKELYDKTHLSITKELASLPNSSMNEDYIKNRHSKIINTIYDDLNI